MDNYYILAPKNPILRHCSDSFFWVLNNKTGNNKSVFCVPKLTANNIWLLIKNLLQTQSHECLYLFLLAVQSDYLVLAFLLRFISKLLSKKLTIYYLMHEPKLEKGRVSIVKSFVIFLHQFLLAYLADMVMLPSSYAVAKAKTFVPTQKIYPIILAFISVPSQILENNLKSLKYRWENEKTFLMLGTASSPDKNPQGFSNFVELIEQHYPQKARFIRGGRDRGIDVNYNEKLIIQFPCYLSELTKSFLLSFTHFVVIPYTVSTQSGVIAEALSYGKLLVLNDIPAFSYLKSYSFAFIVNFNDREAILKCINHLFSMSIEKYESCYWEAIQYFKENHSEHCLSTKLGNIC